MKVEFLPAADRELRAAAVYYERRIRGLERVCALLSDRSALGSRLDALHRRIPLRRFPFALIYRVDAEALRIVAVADRRRRPGYWDKRVD
ncbi:MAG: type II toxin-antitoxin system RelE/ParE family toxin [Steroidobacteraceae bacterium]